jgi:lipopolysaccharide/colanic/teichoic acid biosynthesis glycosyltransferase
MTGEGFGQVGKRLFDIIVGSALLLLALPAIVFCALGVLVSLRTVPFFAQRRVGRNGETFTFIKLRTLPRTAPKYADKYSIGSLNLPWFTGLLRQLHLDELPQLFLVVAGKMSLVGPRPEMPMLHERLPESFAGERTAVRPGCTGLWQIGVNASGLICESPAYDRFYLENQSLKLDLWILAHTLRVMAGRTTVIDLRDVPASVRKQTSRLDASLVDGPRHVTSSGLEVP